MYPLVNSILFVASTFIFFLGTIEITEMTEIVVNLFELEGIEKVKFDSKLNSFIP